MRTTTLVIIGVQMEMTGGYAVRGLECFVTDHLHCRGAWVMMVCFLLSGWQLGFSNFSAKTQSKYLSLACSCSPSLTWATLITMQKPPEAICRSELKYNWSTGGKHANPLNGRMPAPGEDFSCIGQLTPCAILTIYWVWVVAEWNSGF